jgi:hypothetical protein
MATWYYKNGDGTWETLTNWWSNIDGTGSNPATIPWATSATKDDNLDYATGDSTVVDISSNLGVSGNAWTITGTSTVSCKLLKTYVIYSGTYNAAVQVYKSTISGGTFNGAINMFSNDVPEEDAILNGGTFNGVITDISDFPGYSIINGAAIVNSNVDTIVSILGGTFNGTVITNTFWITGGTFNGTVNANSTIYGGTFNGSLNFLINDVIGMSTINGTLTFISNGAIVEGNTLNGTVILHSGTAYEFSTGTSAFNCILQIPTRTQLPPTVTLANLKGLKIDDSITFTKEKGINGSGILGMV